MPYTACSFGDFSGPDMARFPASVYVGKQVICSRYHKMRYISCLKCDMFLVTIVWHEERTMEKRIIEVTRNFVSSEERTRLLRLCLAITGDVDAVEDLVQETLLEAWRHEHILRDATRRRQWLSGIARNVCLRWLRKRRR